MINLQKKIVVDDKGNPLEVIIPWDQYRELEEIHGLDLNDKAREDLNQAKQDRDEGNMDAYIDLDQV